MYVLLRLDSMLLNCSWVHLDGIRTSRLLRGIAPRDGISILELFTLGAGFKVKCFGQTALLDWNRGGGRGGGGLKGCSE